MLADPARFLRWAPALVTSLPVACPSGQRSTPRKRVWGRLHRGFKSHRHRQTEHKSVPPSFVREGLILRVVSMRSQLACGTYRCGRRRVVVLASEQPVYSVRYVVVDRIDHVRVTAGHGGDGPTHDSHQGALTDFLEQEHCCRRVSASCSRRLVVQLSRSNCFHASQSERLFRSALRRPSPRRARLNA